MGCPASASRASQGSANRRLDRNIDANRSRMCIPLAHPGKSAVVYVGQFLAFCGFMLVVGIMYTGVEKLFGFREVRHLERARLETTEEFPVHTSVCLNGGEEYLHVVGTEHEDEYAFSPLMIDEEPPFPLGVLTRGPGDPLEVADGWWPDSDRCYVLGVAAGDDRSTATARILEVDVREGLVWRWFSSAVGRIVGPLRDGS